MEGRIRCRARQDLPALEAGGVVATGSVRPVRQVLGRRWVRPDLHNDAGADILGTETLPSRQQDSWPPANGLR